MGPISLSPSSLRQHLCAVYLVTGKDWNPNLEAMAKMTTDLIILRTDYLLNHGIFHCNRTYLRITHD